VILAGADELLETTNTDNDSDMKTEAEEWKIAHNGQGSRHFGDVAGQPSPTCYPEGISHSKQAADCHGIHFGHGGDRESIVMALSACLCG